MNSEDAFSNFVNAKLKVDETFITALGIARKKKKSYMLKLLGIITTQLLLMLLICQRFIVNY